MNMICEKLNNKNGMEVALLNFGATITSISVPEPDGGRIDLTLGHESAEEYIEDWQYLGSTPGRFANRIDRGQFTLNGKTFQLTLDDTHMHLHGGKTGFAHRYWETAREGGQVVFTYFSPDGENGYPGNLTAKAAYSLNDENELTINYSATTDSDTIINLTNHAYFNLAGGKGTVLDHELQLNADSFVVTDKDLVPTGEIRGTAGTPMDFSSLRRIGDAVGSDYEAILDANGIDSCFVLNGSGLRRAATLVEPSSGRRLEVDTDLPGLQVYTSNSLPEGTKGRDGLVYGQYSAVCLEAQHYPDAPNQSGFPPAVLRKGELFSATIVYRFLF